MKTLNISYQAKNSHGQDGLVITFYIDTNTHPEIRMVCHLEVYEIRNIICVSSEGTIPACIIPEAEKEYLRLKKELSNIL